MPFIQTFESFPEMKRTCNRCGTVWYAQPIDPKLLEALAKPASSHRRQATASRMTLFGGRRAASHEVRAASIERTVATLAEKFGRESRCPSCNSGSYSEKVAPPGNTPGSGAQPKQVSQSNSKAKKPAKPGMSATDRMRAAAQPKSAAKAPAPSRSKATPTKAAAPAAPGAPRDLLFSAPLDEVNVAWAQVLESIPGAVRASVQEAQPLSVHDGVVTFGIRRGAIDAVKPKFQKAAPAIREGFLATLGQVPRFLLVAHDATVEAPADGRRAKRARK